LFKQYWQHVISKKFLQQRSVSLLSILDSSSLASGEKRGGFESLVVNDDTGEIFRLRDESGIVTIEIAKTQGSVSTRATVEP
jgi:hypothetical protein